MKEKIVIFIIGLLLGTIISTGSIYLYTVANSSNNNDQNTMMNGGNPPSMPNGQTGENNTQPEMPNGNGPQNNNQSSSN